jgi:hypothetical protein
VTGPSSTNTLSSVCTTIAHAFLKNPETAMDRLSDVESLEPSEVSVCNRRMPRASSSTLPN